MSKFVCSYCGKEYDDAIDRARCEIKCGDIQRKARAEEEKRVDAQEIDNMLNAVISKISSFEKKYGKYKPTPETSAKIDNCADTLLSMIYSMLI